MSQIGPKTANRTLGNCAAASTSARVCVDSATARPGATRDVGGAERPAAEVHAVGVDGERDVDAIIDIEAGAGRAREVAELAREGREVASAEILLAQLHGDGAARLEGHGREGRAHDVGEWTPHRRVAVRDEIEPGDGAGHRQARYSMRPSRGDDADA